MNIGINQYQKKNIVKLKSEDFVYEIDSLFNSVLDQYGIEDSWRKKTRIKNQKFDSLNYVYFISLPNDLTVSEVVQAENFNFVNLHSKFISKELKNYGKTKIEIYSHNILKLEAFLNVDTSYYRNKSKISLLINLEDIEDSQSINSILSSQFPLCIASIPSEKFFDVKNLIESKNKSFAVMITDNIEDERYLLESGLSKSKLLRNIKAIYKDFSQADMFIIDDYSEIAKSVEYNFIYSKFKKMGKKLIKLSNFILLQSENVQDVISRFKFYAAGKDTSQVSKIVVSVQNFELLIPEFKSSLRKGTKFVLN